jgi:hypothetical protein
MFWEWVWSKLLYVRYFCYWSIISSEWLRVFFEWDVGIREVPRVERRMLCVNMDLVLWFCVIELGECLSKSIEWIGRVFKFWMLELKKILVFLQKKEFWWILNEFLSQKKSYYEEREYLIRYDIWVFWLCDWSSILYLLFECIFEVR